MYRTRYFKLSLKLYIYFFFRREATIATEGILFANPPLTLVQVWIVCFTRWSPPPSRRTPFGKVVAGGLSQLVARWASNLWDRVRLPVAPMLDRRFILFASVPWSLAVLISLPSAEIHDARTSSHSPTQLIARKTTFWLINRLCWKKSQKPMQRIEFLQTSGRSHRKIIRGQDRGWRQWARFTNDRGLNVRTNFLREGNWIGFFGSQV